MNSKESSKERCKENEEVVKSEVAAFMDSASITENNLKRLEKKIRNKVASGVGKTKDEDDYSILSSASGAASGAGKAGAGRSGVSAASAVSQSHVEKESSLYMKLVMHPLNEVIHPFILSRMSRNKRVIRLN